MAGWKIGPSLAAGCTIVLKPAPGTPLTTLMLAELIKEAGIPDGVVNILSGGNDAGQALAEHHDVRMICVTGSTGTGKKVMKTAADTLKARSASAKPPCTWPRTKAYFAAMAWS
jgi:betaine-aldehyde dehydrogenase